MMKKERKMKKFGFHTQNPRRFSGFTVVVVNFFVKLLDDFHDFLFGMCLFPEENQQPIMGGHHILPTEIDEKNR